MAAFFQLSPIERIKLQFAAGRAFSKYDYGSDSQDENGVNSLANRLASAGVNDIRDIHYSKSVVPIADPNEGVMWIETGFWYNAETGKELAGFGGDYNDTAKPEAFFDLLTIQGNGGHWDYYYFLRRNPTGHPYFVFYPIWVPEIKDTFTQDMFSLNPSRTWRAIKEVLKAVAPLLPIVMVVAAIVFPAAIPAMQMAIGSAVVGPATAAAYPLLAQTIGSVAINTLANGGDVESAVKGAGLSIAGAQAGAFSNSAVSSAVDSQLAGVLAGAATKALIVGGDMEKAVAISLLQYTGSGGRNSVVDETAFSEPKGDDMELTFDSGLFDSTFDSSSAFDAGDAAMIDTGFGSSDMFQSFDSSVFNTEGSVFDFSSIESYPGFGSWFGEFDESQIAEFDPSATVDLSSADLASAWDFDSVIEGLSDVALAAIKINAAYQATQKPVVRSIAPTTRVNSNGTVTTTSSEGGIVTTRPNVGQPFQAANNDIIINNGDGTYTTIRPDGSQMMKNYGGSVGSLGLDQKSLLLYGGLGLIGVLLLSRR